MCGADVQLTIKTTGPGPPAWPRSRLALSARGGLARGKREAGFGVDRYGAGSSTSTRRRHETAGWNLWPRSGTRQAGWPDDGNAVRGATAARAQRTTQSAQSRRGLGLARRKTATSWRSMRSSDVLGGGPVAHQQDQPEHLHKDQVKQPLRHVGTLCDRRSLLVSDPRLSSGTPHGAQIVDVPGRHCLTHVRPRWSGQRAERLRRPHDDAARILPPSAEGPWRRVLREPLIPFPPVVGRVFRCRSGSRSRW